MRTSSVENSLKQENSSVKTSLIQKNNNSQIHLDSLSPVVNNNKCPRKGSPKTGPLGSNLDHPHHYVPLTSIQKLILGLTLSMTLFLVALEQTVISASLPQISAELVSSEGYEWIGSAYLLSSASVIPIHGKLSDIFGRKPTILVSIAIFLVGSAIAGASVNMPMLIAARAIQGLGGGSIFSLINIIISDIIPLDQRGTFIGLIECTWMLASCIGPLIGGSLTQTGHWRWCFYLNLPVGGVCMTNLLLVLKLHRQHTTLQRSIQRIDFIGIVLSAGATCLLVLALDWGGTIRPWKSATIIGSLVSSAAIFAIFMIYEYKVPNEPIIPPKLLKTRTRFFSYAAAFFHGNAFMGVTYYLPFMFQSVYGVSPILASLYIVPMSVFMGATSALGGFLVSKTGRYTEIQRVGMALTTVTIAVLSTLNPSSNTVKRIMFPVLYGIFLGFNFHTFLISMQTNIEPNDIGVATSILIYIRQLGLSISVAIGGVTFENKVTQLAENSDSPILKAIQSGNAPSSVQIVKLLPGPLKDQARNNYSIAFQTLFYVFIAISGTGFLLTWFIPQNSLKMNNEKQNFIHNSDNTSTKEKKPDSTQYNNY